MNLHVQFLNFDCQQLRYNISNEHKTTITGGANLKKSKIALALSFDVVVGVIELNEQHKHIELYVVLVSILYGKLAYNAFSRYLLVQQDITCLYSRILRGISESFIQF